MKPIEIIAIAWLALTLGAGIFTAGYTTAATPPQGDYPRVTSNVGQYTHITTTTATAAKATPGRLLSVTIGTGAAGNITVFDLAAASCTGTPATNQVSIIGVAATTTPMTLTFNTEMQNGICIKTSAAMDMTAVTQ